MPISVPVQDPTRNDRGETQVWNACLISAAVLIFIFTHSQAFAAEATIPPSQNSSTQTDGTTSRALQRPFPGGLKLDFGLSLGTVGANTSPSFDMKAGANQADDDKAMSFTESSASDRISLDPADGWIQYRMSKSEPSGQEFDAQTNGGGGKLVFRWRFEPSTPP